METTKPIFASKTAIFNLVATLAMLYPPAGAIVAANPEGSVAVLTLANLLLRFVTKKKVTLF